MSDHTTTPNEPSADEAPVAAPSLDAILEKVLETGNIRKGRPLPLGVHLQGGGANFAIFSRHATRIWLEFYDAPEDAAPSRRVELDAERHQTGDIWHVWVGRAPDWTDEAARTLACRIRGLKEGLGTNGICSVYGYESAEETWQMLKGFQEGRAIFTAPSGPFKGGGAPLKILHRADAFWREAGVREKVELIFATAGSKDFGGEEYVELVERDTREKDVRVYFGYDLVEVRPERREAVFHVSKEEVVSRDLLPFDLIHVVPPMRPPQVIAKSPLAYQVGPMKGYLEVNADTLRHKHYKNVFGLGDVAGLFTEKTGEKARKQAATLARNLQHVITEEQ